MSNLTKKEKELTKIQILITMKKLKIFYPLI